MSPEQVVFILMIGLAAGVIGGLAGIGGSLVMIPGLALCLGSRDASHTDQHLYMASAMCVNIVVAVRATRRHARAGAIRPAISRGVLLGMAPAMIVGVLLSNLVDGSHLRVALAGFVGVYALGLIARAGLGDRRAEGGDAPPPRPAFGLAPGSPIEGAPPTRRLASIGAGAGVIGGLLGLGGGVVMVPALQVAARVPLRQAVAASAHAMQLASLIGATAKVASLPALDLEIGRALAIAGLMGLTAVLGAPLGAGLTHRLPIRWVRATIGAALLASAARLAGLF